MPIDLFYTMVQKSQKWPKTQIKGGSCLKAVHTFLDNMFRSVSLQVQYVGRTMQRLEERIKQHVPKSLFTGAGCQENE